MALLMHECAVAVELPRAASGHRVRYQMELVIGDAAIGTQSNNNMKQSTSQPVSHSIPIKYAQWITLVAFFFLLLLLSRLASALYRTVHTKRVTHRCDVRLPAIRAAIRYCAGLQNLRTICEEQNGHCPVVKIKIKHVYVPVVYYEASLKALITFCLYECSFFFCSPEWARG